MNHTAGYMSIAIGQVVVVKCETWRIPMKVIDVKSSWGKIRLQVRPLSGIGEQWIEMDRVTKGGLIPTESETKQYNEYKELLAIGQKG